MTRVLLIIPTATYRAADFLQAAAQLGVDVTVASEEPNTLQHLNRSAFFLLNHHTADELAARVLEFSRRFPIDAVVPVDSGAAIDSATISSKLELPGNSPSAVTASLHKYLQRRCITEAGVPGPDYQLVPFPSENEPLPPVQVGFPCVIKPLALSGSQGVMRVDGPQQLRPAVQRLARIVAGSPAHHRSRYPPDIDPARSFLIESYVAGPEFSLEALLTRGTLRVLALFDKPDPLDGPFFEETIYVTPSRLSGDRQAAIADCVERACRAIGLQHGPVHAEVRMLGDGPRLIEVNARSIGGLCSRTLRFGLGMSLEELILRHALDDQFALPSRERAAAGVMMIPIGRGGVLQDVSGVESARAVPGIEQLVISAHRGERLEPPPDGGRYLGFLFARGRDPDLVEQSLRAAHAMLRFDIRPDDAHHRGDEPPAADALQPYAVPGDEA